MDQLKYFLDMLPEHFQMKFLLDLQENNDRMLYDYPELNKLSLINQKEFKKSR